MDHVKANLGDVNVASEIVQIQTFLLWVKGKMNFAVISTEERPIIWRCLFDARRSKLEQFA
jgi:hypothetical protein